MSTDALCNPSGVRALAGFAIMVATILHRQNIIEIGEFGDLMAIYATITGESDPRAGLQLAYVASAMKEAAVSI